MVHLRSSAADTCLLRPRRAATLPIAGLTALYALERGGPLLGRSVLTTGASGGVGQFACQPVRHGGAARVVGVVRFVAHAEEARAAGAQEVVVGEDNAGAARFGPYDVILDSLGGASLASALPLVAEGGTCIAFGTTGGGESTIRVWDLCGRGRVTLYGFLINYEVKHKPIASGRRASRGWSPTGRCARVSEPRRRGRRLPGRGKACWSGASPARPCST